MIRLAMAYVPSRAIAEEVVQESWMAMVQGPHGHESTLCREYLSLHCSHGKGVNGLGEFHYVEAAETNPPTQEDFRTNWGWGGVCRSNFDDNLKRERP